jgi:hypothetical protein
MFIVPLFLGLAGAVQLIEGAAEYAAGHASTTASRTPAPTFPAPGRLSRWLIKVLPDWFVTGIAIILLLCFPAMWGLLIYAVFNL